MIDTILGIELVEQKLILFGRGKLLTGILANVVAYMNRELLLPEFMFFDCANFLYPSPSPSMY